MLHAKQEGLARTDESHEYSKESETEVLSKTQAEESSREHMFYIRELVLIPDEVLLMVHLPSGNFSRLGDRSMVFCVYSEEIIAKVNGIEYLHGRVVVRCQLPQEGVDQDLSKGSERKLLSLYILDRDLNRHIKHIGQPAIMKWDFLVYESLSTSRDVVLFAKGVNQRKGLNAKPESLHCVFNGTVVTSVTISSQEVFRCMHPHQSYRSDLVDTKVSLSWHGQIMPSVAYYQLPMDLTRKRESSDPQALCSCTMVFNVAKFLMEWVMYHSYLGVDHFFLYDNNSEDNLEGTLSILGRQFNVSRHPWPWIKTQEAGFAHCALLASKKCQWMLYVDVDEFVFSPRWLQLLKEETQSTKKESKIRSRSIPSHITQKALKSSIMKRNADNKRKKHPVGQISIRCNNFGPSGLKMHPERGVTQGYTCRQKSQQRHKSIVLLEALPPSLGNVVHHFELKPRYITEYMKPSKIMINHYKYQAWSEFKSKFRRRVSAYVVDWKEPVNPGSQDRTPGLGNQAIEPPHWEKRFCDLNDTRLKDFALKLFSSGSKMLWQL